MFYKLLGSDDRKYLLKMAKLLVLCDKPLLWDGKPSNEIKTGTNLDVLSIVESENEREIIDELEIFAGMTDGFGFRDMESSEQVHDLLIGALKEFPISMVEKPEVRLQAAGRVFKNIVGDRRFDIPTVPKAVLFELLMVALGDGHVAGIKWTLLKDFQKYHKIDDFIFDDLLECAEALSRETSKTLSIILE
ncbi:MAG: hypothetical protein LKF64_09530 [Alcaligenes faecalis]|jgi:hypothetical protein|nr:hypothetical protein [Alcaligenes faecalis]